MKLKNKYLAIAALGAVGLTSCSDTLNVDSPSQMDQTMVYSSTEFATNAINGVYVLFGEDPYTSRMCGVWMQNTDVEAMGVSATTATNHRNAVWPLQGAGNVGWSDVKKVWDNNLQAIERANQVRAGIDASAIGQQDEMQQIKGEATCLKAYRYYLMCNFFGDVPYYDEAAKSVPRWSVLPTPPAMTFCSTGGKSPAAHSAAPPRGFSTRGACISGRAVCRSRGRCWQRRCWAVCRKS